MIRMLVVLAAVLGVAGIAMVLTNPDGTLKNVWGNALSFLGFSVATVYAFLDDADGWGAWIILAITVLDGWFGYIAWARWRLTLEVSEQ